MVRFLIKRPIAVLMTVVATLVLGIYAYLTLPVSLLPNLDIPKITVRVTYSGIDARNFENTITKPIRTHLTQVTGLKNIESDTYDGYTEIILHFSYSVNTKLAFIETNEKLDEIMSLFPVDMERPMVIKEKPSDIPVFYLNVTPTDRFYTEGNTFNELCDFTLSVLKKRLEQLSDVSMVDISGLEDTRIEIIPDSEKTSLLKLSYADIASAIKRNNYKVGNLGFRDGHYSYRLKISPVIKTVSDIKNIEIRKGENLIRLDEVADIKKVNYSKEGMFFHNGDRAISIAVYKHIDARMEDVSKNIQTVSQDIQTTNPNIIIDFERDQTKLLSYSLDNLKQTLVIGLILAIIIVFLIMKRPKLAIMVVISVPVSLIIAFMGLKISGISLNIISLSGMIFSVGLMIDNSIIIIDNINQHHKKEKNLYNAVVDGTNEVIRPLISSMLTTCAVFIPLISLSGISGALFFDQAITITVSLVVSLLVSIMVIPVIYYHLLKKSQSNVVNNDKLISIYEKALQVVMRNKMTFLLLFTLLVPLGVLLFLITDKEQFPHIKQNDFICKINWIEPVSLNENKKRVSQLMDANSYDNITSSVYLGKSGFYLQKESQQSITEASIYINTIKNNSVDSLANSIVSSIEHSFPGSQVSIEPSKNIFQVVFNPEKDDLVAKFRNNSYDFVDYNFVKNIEKLLSTHSIIDNNSSKLLNELFVLEIEPDKLLLYGISLDNILAKLRIMFGNYELDKLSKGNNSLSIIMSENNDNLFNKLEKATIINNDGTNYPLKEFISINKTHRLKNIKSDQKGEFFDMEFSNSETDEDLEKKITELMKSTGLSDVDFDGSLQENKILFRELLFVLLVSLTLLYLILAAQFESLLLPLIILLEIVFDISGALLFIYIFNSSLNIMSALGIIVMMGIIINDSIIKIDTIRRTYITNPSLTEAIMEGGRRRFNPIIMTSLTTILALVPFLFFEGIGVELQLPLALSIIGGLLVGTIVSLFFIPVMYYYFAKVTSWTIGK